MTGAGAIATGPVRLLRPSWGIEDYSGAAVWLSGDGRVLRIDGDPTTIAAVEDIDAKRCRATIMDDRDIADQIDRDRGVGRRRFPIGIGAGAPLRG